MSKFSNENAKILLAHNYTDRPAIRKQCILKIDPQLISLTKISSQDVNNHELSNVSDSKYSNLLEDFKRNCNGVICDKSYDEYQLLQEQLKCLYRLDFQRKHEIFKILRDLRDQSKHCDLVMITTGSEYAAHQAVFALHSKSIRMLASKRRKDFVLRVNLHRSDYNGINYVIAYAYMEDIVISSQNLVSICKTARELGFRQLFNYCQEYLRVNLSRQCGNVYVLSNECLLMRHSEFVLKSLRQDLHLYLNHESFVRIPLNDLLKVIAVASSRSRKSEAVLLGTLLKYIFVNNYVNNERVILSILKQVRWGELSKSEFINLIPILNALLSSVNYAYTFVLEKFHKIKF
ncbi:hypothetical protein GJ496_010918 [Pomphorhynchus laevis]|nr:hypothetical protein GJ496_010918 [Pomphorhynchus laevis]